MEEALACSVTECKRRSGEVDSMDFKTLEQYNTKCANCGSWLLKESDVANATYHKVSNRWAAAFNDNLIQKR